ncbi:NADH-quinone oxidoreductase subunit L [Streptomyces sp. TRM S81-3]|uniref:NADH-quinone oxidoreductase subunit L n=1 Tax=Streptomyces griseicoloratus TaxID=2752516 RepID=A0A926QRM9_9ACTN|nr:proton-conducting transporter membrane subunit [Streptomyces griseicoloratus]MBD0420097.1 NADH-quinone oxidoreductase subunit L [Streptomyces griseicoloratus]
MSALLWALVAVPLVSGALLLAAGRAADRLAPGTGLAAATAGTGLAVAAAFRQPETAAPFLDGLPVRLAVDGLSGLLAVTVTGATLAVLLHSAAGSGAGEARARFFGLMLLFSGSMLVTVTAATLPVLLLGWEVMGATSWALIGYRWRDPERARAAGTAFLTTRAADLGLYLAAGAALAGGGNPALSLAGLSAAREPWLSFVTAGVVVAALGKSAQLPLSFWLSKAMLGPSPVSALLHSAAMVVAGAYLLLRTGPLPAASGWGDDVVAWTGAATALSLGLVAVAQSDLKQLLAASTCAQTGFMVLAAGAGARTGGVLQLIAHAAAKSLLFLVAGSWLSALGTQRLRELRGAARHSPAAGAAFTVAALTLAGLAPLSLWAAKDLLLAGALRTGPWLYAAGLAAAVLSAVYSAKALWFVWRPPVPRPGARPVPGGAVASLVPQALACLALTPLAFPPLLDRVARVLGSPGEPAPRPWEFALSAGLALTAAALTWARSARPLPLPGAVATGLAEWLFLERAAGRLLVGPVLRLAAAAAAFDDRVLDRAVDTAATAALRCARWTDRVAERSVDAAVTAVAAGTRALGRRARRPQTGQLHQYLIQAVAAFALLAAVLVLVR